MRFYSFIEVLTNDLPLHRLVAGNELVEAAAQALKIKLQFTSISE